MSAHGSLLASKPPASWIYDFDLVTVDGRPLLVGTPDIDHRVVSWDPSTDRWTEYLLDNPAPEEGADYTQLTSLGAAVVDGRIVIGGGGEHQGFATWDLETGKVRLREEPGAVGSTTAVDLDGRALFVVGSSDGPGVTLWDAAVAETDGVEGDWRDAMSVLDQSPAHHHRVEHDEMTSLSYASSAVAAGLLAGSPILVANAGGSVQVWDVDQRCALRAFDDPAGRRAGFEPTDFVLIAVAGRTWLVAAGGHHVVLGDPEVGAWADPLDVPGAAISCLDARAIDGRAIAVTGAEDGTICAWDVAERRLLAEPFREHGSVVYGVRIAELDGRLVVVSTAHQDAVRVVELPWN